MKSTAEAYQDTVTRMEPDISFIDTAAGWASCAVSLKRIADTLDGLYRAFIVLVFFMGMAAGSLLAVRMIQ